MEKEVKKKMNGGEPPFEQNGQSNGEQQLDNSLAAETRETSQRLNARARRADRRSYGGFCHS